MSIEGTDGYSNSNTEDLSKNVINYECVLNVPGANTEGVKDVCTIGFSACDTAGAATHSAAPDTKASVAALITFFIPILLL